MTLNYGSLSNMYLTMGTPGMTDHGSTNDTTSANHGRAIAAVNITL